MLPNSGFVFLAECVNVLQMGLQARETRLGSSSLHVPPAAKTPLSDRLDELIAESTLDAMKQVRTKTPPRASRWAARLEPTALESNR